jgi:hypothetical protein
MVFSYPPNNAKLQRGSVPPKASTVNVQEFAVRPRTYNSAVQTELTQGLWESARTCYLVTKSETESAFQKPQEFQAAKPLNLNAQESRFLVNRKQLFLEQRVQVFAR